MNFHPILEIRLQEFLFERFHIDISSNLKQSEKHTFYYTRKEKCHDILLHKERKMS